MGKRVFHYQNEPVRAVRVVARRGNKIVAQTPIRHSQAPDGPIISFQRRWLLKRYPELANATFHLIPADEKDDNIQEERPTRAVSRKPPPAHLEKRSASKIVSGNSRGIPDRIREFKYPGWTNVFDLVPKNDHVYPVAIDPDWRAQFNDWNGKILLLAKDGCPTHVIRTLRDKPEREPWRFAQLELGDKGGVRSNERLYRFASTIPGGKLYGSAAANMLYDDPRWSRPLSGFRRPDLGEYFQFVLTWVLTSMHRVKWVACLGEDAWFLACQTLGQTAAAGNFNFYRDSHKSVAGKVGKKAIGLFPMHHPSRGANDVLGREWREFSQTVKGE